MARRKKVHRRMVSREAAWKRHLYQGRKEEGRTLGNGKEDRMDQKLMKEWSSKESQILHKVVRNIK